MEKKKAKTPARDYQLARLMEAFFFIAMKELGREGFEKSEIDKFLRDAITRLDIPESKRAELIGSLLLKKSIPDPIKKKPQRLLRATIRS